MCTSSIAFPRAPPQIISGRPGGGSIGHHEVGSEALTKEHIFLVLLYPSRTWNKPL